MNRFYKFLVAAFMSAAMLLPNMARATSEGDALLRAQQLQQEKREIIKNAMRVTQNQVERDLGTENDEYSISAAILSAATLSPDAVMAMEFHAFDNMAAQDQQAFLDFLPKAAEAVLNQEGRSDDATNVHDLFVLFPPNSDLPLGEAEHEMNLDIARVADAKRAIQNPGSPQVQVEAALVVTLKKNGFELSPDFLKSFAQMASTFKPKQPPAGAIPKPNDKGTRNAMLQLAQIVAWNSGNDQRWYYYTGDLVPDAFKLTGVLESPLFDSRLKNDIMPSPGFRDKIIPLEASIKSQLPPGSEFREEFGDWICNVYTGIYYCAHLYALDFEKAEVDDHYLLIPCRSGIVRGGAPYGDALCSIHGREWKEADGTANKVVFIGEDLNASVQTDMMFTVASQESGQAILSALSQLAAEFERYYEPTPVKSIPIQ